MAAPNPLLAVVLALAVAGCAAATPGFAPPDPKGDKFRALAPSGGGLDSSGRYILNDQEQKADCKKINSMIYVGILQMREEGERYRPSVAAKAARAALSPISAGSTHGLDPDADRARAMARMETLNARLAEKGCGTFDLKAQLAPGNTEIPTPAKVEKKRKTQ